MENLVKKNEDSLESILKNLEEADNVGAMIMYSRRAAVWAAREHPGMTLLGQDVATIFKAENLDKSEFLSAFTAELIRQRRKFKIDNSKIDRDSIGLRKKQTLKLSKIIVSSHLKPKMEKG